jgi:hypothetical protein
MKHSLLLICGLFLSGIVCAREGTAAQTEKMCWAHYVGWGFDQVDGYDRAAALPAWYAQRFNDRSLLGRHAQTDEGVAEATPLQVRTALAYGIDGFCVDLVIQPTRSETFYADAMARFYRAAEGTPFKIALCVDSTPVSRDALTRAFAAFLTRWGHHPNACLVDGRPVIFIYNPRPRSNDDWHAILADLRAQGLSATWLVQPMGEGTLWDKPDVLAAHLSVFDGLYDFGINGFSTEQIIARLANGKRALAAAHKPDALWVAGITVGYLGNANSFYRPYLNTGTLRNNWEAALATDAPWVCLTTWNDYVENTHFEPSTVNRDALLRINRDYVARWRNTPVPPRPPQIVISYHEEVSLGDDATLEALSLPYQTAPAALDIRLEPLEDPATTSVFNVSLPADRIHAETLRIAHPFLAQGGGVFRVQARLASDDGQTNAWQTLYPIAVRNGHLESLRTVRIPLDELADEPRLALANDGGRRVARIRFDRWNIAGRIELLRNGWPVAETEIAHKGAPSVTVSLPLPETDDTPDDLFVARFSTLAGHVAWSAPVRAGNHGAAAAPQPVIVTGTDFDEGWWTVPSVTSGPPSLDSAPLRSTYALTYPMTEGAGDLLTSTSGWRTPLFLGRTHRHLLGAEPDRCPLWTRGEKGSWALAFDGTNDCAVLPSRSFPYGPFTLEMNIRPQKTGVPQTLFADTCGVSLALTPDGHVRFSRRSNALVSQHPVRLGRWTHLTAVYDGAHLRLSFDDTAEGETPAETNVLRINSLPVIGNDASGQTGFGGCIGGVHLQSGVLSLGHSALLPRSDSTADTP